MIEIGAAIFLVKEYWLTVIAPLNNMLRQIRKIVAKRLTRH